jgi:hypothetical protein
MLASDDSPVKAAVEFLVLAWPKPASRNAGRIAMDVLQASTGARAGAGNVRRIDVEGHRSPG